MPRIAAWSSAPIAERHMFEIYVVARDGEQPGEPRPAAEFGLAGGTIGRADDNTLVLPDPDRLVSRVQAGVRVVDDARLLIANAAASSRFLVNGRELAPGEEVELREGDQLRMGPYVLGVRDRRDFGNSTIGPSDRLNTRT